jgi:GNAT superfamily N-acetyltransferase
MPDVRRRASPGPIHTRLEDGSAVCIRTIEPDDEARMRAGIARMSPHSRYMRFFTGLRVPPDSVIDRLIEADGYRHIAWGAIAMDRPGQPAAGAVHAYRSQDDDECAEFSVAIVDDYHGLGLGKLLTATILLDAATQGVTEFQLYTLAENRRAIDFIGSLGARMVGRDGTALEFHLNVAQALEALRSREDPPGIRDVFAAFDTAAAAAVSPPASGTPPAP